MLNYDFHSHSDRSDGTLAPDELVGRAAMRGVTTLALTDHDDTGGLDTARLAALNYGVDLIEGVEISVTWRGRVLHVLGLYIDSHYSPLQAGLAEIRNQRYARAKKISAQLDILGIEGSFQGARRFARNPDMIGRMHFARLLLERGIVADIAGAFRRFLGEQGGAYVSQEWARLADAIGWINGSGGVAVLAHPGRYRLSAGAMRQLLSEFSELGGAGIEVATFSHDAAARRTFSAHAHYYGLAESGGSDFHAPNESRHDLGDLPPIAPSSVPIWQSLRGTKRTVTSCDSTCR